MAGSKTKYQLQVGEKAYKTELGGVKNYTDNIVIVGGVLFSNISATKDNLI